jgi:hypothetical protein
VKKAEGAVVAAATAAPEKKVRSHLGGIPLL